MINNVIEKSNVLNAMKMLSEPDEKIGLIEFRFFCLYLSKINARNPEKRTVKVKIEDFEELFGVSFHSTSFTKQLRKIATRQMRVIEKGKCIIINLYSKFAWSIENPKELEITCNYDIMPYLFELQKSYTSYKILNIVKLNSVQKIRLYEIMKQYEKIGQVGFDIKDLQEMLCSKVQEFRFFRRDILTPAIRDINQYTDIQVSYEKNLSCRKVVALTFTIDKKKIFSADNVDEQSVDTTIQSLYYRCKEEYTIKQLEQLYDYVSNCCVNISSGVDNYIYSVYANIKISGNKINNLFKYTFSVIKNDITKHIFEDSRDNSNSHTSRSDEMYISSYDINDVIRDHRIEWYTQEDLEKRSIKILDKADKTDKTVKDEVIKEEPQKIEEPVVVQEAYEREKSQELPVIEFRFAFDKDLTDYVNYDSCKRLQALLELKYHKEDTFWLFEDIFTQKDIIKLVLERHQVIVVPKPVPVGDFEEYQKNSELCEIK